MKHNNKKGRNILYLCMLLLPGCVYFLFPHEIRRRFLFEIIRQVILVLPLAVLAMYVFAKSWVFPSDHMKRLTARLSAVHIYLPAVLVIMLILRLEVLSGKKLAIQAQPVQLILSMVSCMMQMEMSEK